MTAQTPIPESLVTRAIKVFGTEAKARRWLNRAHPALDGLTPPEAAQSEKGRARVEQLLNRIEHGIYE